jgi:hypothetical protein
MNKAVTAIALTSVLATSALAAVCDVEARVDHRHAQSISEKWTAPKDRVSQYKDPYWSYCPDPDHVWDSRCY